MTERKAAVTFQSKPLTLVGKEIKVGDAIPEVTLVNNDLQEVKLSSYKGKNLLLLSVPSLDTSVCSMETSKFNKEIAGLKDNLKVLTISMDLPFAQKRWCGQEKVTNLQTLSDYRTGEFGMQFGVLIKELHLLARAIFFVDQEGVVRYHYLVKEVTSEPPYEEVLQAVKQCTTCKR